MEQRWALQRKAMDELLAKHGVEKPIYGAEAGLGWIPILDKMFTMMGQLGKIPKVTQIKQKFGGLIVYFEGELTRDQDEILAEAVRKANLSCEDCGKDHGRSLPLCGRALCDSCAARSQ